MTALVDLRSDTVTRPTPAMRKAMAEAEVGDDVYREDPTVNRLEERAAEIFEREAALFVPSGTMANQIAVKVHTQPGQEIVCEERSHILNYEMGMMAAFSGCLARSVRAERGIMSWPLIAAALRGHSDQHSQTGLISLENTSNIAGGTVYSVESCEAICEQAHSAAIPVHLDGARIFNAAVHLGMPVARLTQAFDSLMFCLSKGLGAPVGSLVLGSRDFIEESRIIRKMLGGGMRQAGVLAAAGLVALEESPARLNIDHENARFLAEGLAQLPGVRIKVEHVVTNIIVVDLAAASLAAQEISKRLGERGVLADTISPTSIRMVTHYDVDRTDCERALKAMKEIVAVKVTVH